jgi:photosynthetic reaction center cytochrome c subunit
MTQHINETYPEHVQPAGVTCYTCHRGENRPSGTFYNLVPVVDVMEGWSANQNRVTPVSEWTSLPSDALQKYLVEYEPIRVSDLEPRVPSEGTASIQRTERTFSLMNHQSNALGVNCTFCHNSRAFYDLDQSTPQLLQAQLGIAMALDINNEYVLPLGELLPANRLGPVHQDPPKVACMTCHKGNAKPVGGLAVLHDWPELGSSEPPVYE